MVAPSVVRRQRVIIPSPEMLEYSFRYQFIQKTFAKCLLFTRHSVISKEEGSLLLVKEQGTTQIQDEGRVGTRQG